MKFNKLFLPLILLAAVLLRLWNFTATSLWHDEAFSALLIRMPFGEMMHRIALDVHPPFYYWLLRFWSDVLGYSLASLRGFSVFFGVASVLMLYFLVKEVTEKKNLAVGAAALLAVNPFHLQYSFEARMYTLGTFLVIASTWVMLKSLKNNSWRWWLPFALLTTAGALTHYFIFFSIVAQGLFIFVYWIKNCKPRFTLKHLNWLWSFILAIALYIPWAPTFLKQFGQVQDSYWIPKMDVWSVPNTIWKILLGGFQGAPHDALLASTIVLIALLLVYLIYYRSFKLWLPVFLSLVPFVLAVLVSLRNSLFMDRYFIFASVFATTIVALALLAVKPKLFGRALLLGAVVASIISYAIGWEKVQADSHPGMRAAAENILTQAKPGDKVLIASTFVDFTYLYYYQQHLDKNPQVAPPKSDLYLQGITSLSQLPHFSGTALLSEDDYVGNLTHYAKTGQQVYLLWTTGWGSNKPQVPANWIQMSESKYSDVFGYRGDDYVTKYLVR